MCFDGRRSSHVRIARTFSPIGPISIFYYPTPPPPFTTASARLRTLLEEELSIEPPLPGAHSAGIDIVAGRPPRHLACSRDKASRRRSSPTSRPPSDAVCRRLSHCPLVSWVELPSLPRSSAPSELLPPDPGVGSLSAVTRHLRLAHVPPKESRLLFLFLACSSQPDS
jgi:hypothetical protein